MVGVSKIKFQNIIRIDVVSFSVVSKAKTQLRKIKDSAVTRSCFTIII